MSNKTAASRALRPQRDARSVRAGHPLPRHVVCELFEYLEEGLALTGCDHSFHCSEAFLAANDIALRPTLEWLCRHGASCDCEVLEEFEQRWLSPSLGGEEG